MSEQIEHTRNDATADASLAPPHPAPPHPAKLIAIGALAMVMLLLVLSQMPGVNGPAYWQWNWRRLDPLRLYPAMAVAAAAFFLAQYSFVRRAILPPRLLPLLALSTFALQIVVVSLETRPASLEPIVAIVQHPYCTSYFTAAQGVVARGVATDDEHIWLRYLKHYPDRMHRAVMHARGKPPGIILYYYALLKTMPSERSAALAGGIIIALLAACAGPATYGMMRCLEFDRETAFAAASLVALSPGLILVMPQFDQVYPLVTCGLIATWALALRQNRVIFSVAFALILTVATFLAHHLLVLGLFLGGYTLLRRAWHLSAAASVARHAGTAIAIFAAIYFVFWLTTGFDPIATLRGAFQTFAEMNEWMAGIGKARPWTSTVVFDLTDFAMAGGWIIVLLALLGLASPQPQRQRIISMMALGQILAIALFALLPTETFRTWIFLLPLIAIPAATELRRWPDQWRIGLFAALWLLLVAIGENMQFNDWRQPIVGAGPATTSTTQVIDGRR